MNLDITQWKSIILVVDINHNQFILINIYASKSKFSNLVLFQDTESKACSSFYSLSKVIWGGDFNIIFKENNTYVYK